MNNKAKRIMIYVLGLFIMALGVSFSVKSNLGVSPVSTIPYTVTLIFGMEMGKATICFHICLILIQVIILRRDFKVKNLFQIIVAFMFGYFTTFSNYLLSFVPELPNYLMRLVFLAISIVLIGCGIFMYMSSDMIPLAGEGVMAAISFKTKLPFSKSKISFDVSMVLISLITCLISIKSFGSVREGTIIAALLVGTVLGIVTRMFKEKLDNFLGKNNLEDLEDDKISA